MAAPACKSDVEYNFAAASGDHLGRGGQGRVPQSHTLNLMLSLHVNECLCMHGATVAGCPPMT